MSDETENLDPEEMSETDPWRYAFVGGRAFITSEDIDVAASFISGGGDPEVDHSSLDDLWETVLEAIGEKRVDDASRCASAAVSALSRVKIRWYA